MNSGQPSRTDPPADAASGDDDLPLAKMEVEDTDEESTDLIPQATPVDGIPVASPDVVRAQMVDGVRRRHPGESGISDSIFRADEFLAKRYDMIRRIGKGGMSAVYLANDRQLHRNVAVKVTKPFDDEEAAVYTSRFVNEARILARLNHPNIVHVYDFAASESGMRIIMEYVQGRTLYQQVKEDGPLSEVEVAAIACEVLDAIEVIHAEGVIHRDMKPGNVMLDDKGRVKVMDFGIAMTEGLDTDASSGSVVGTIKFMAPEQSRAEAVTERSDLFSVGATMAFMLLGELPSVLRADQLPPQLKPVLMRAMAADPAARYATAAEMREAIELAIRTPPPRTGGVARKLLLLALPVVGIGIGLALAGLLVLAEWLGRDDPPRVTEPEPPGVVIEDGGIDDVVSGGGMFVIEDADDEEERSEDTSRENDAARERRHQREREREKEREKVGESEAAGDDQEAEPRATTPTRGSSVADRPSIKHPIVTSVRAGDPVRFEVYVFGDESYSVSISYRATAGGSWRTLTLRDRGEDRYTGNLRIGGELADGVAYYVSVFEETGANRAFTRGSLNDPYIIPVD